MSPGDLRDERGSAIVELVWLGILLLVPLLWIVVSVFQVQSGAFAVSSAARSAGRAFALAPDDISGQRAAEAAARQSLRDQGIDEVPVDVAVTCTPYPTSCHLGHHGGRHLAGGSATHARLPRW